ncbi:N-acetylmuramoyl-L-alanine amidase [Pukyongiella litopenaei]|uniref:N-acetylmuramoyl-L-alanine amidase n=1 Tax=Pukyongiella litopenaei TaxID=2605946 RepID=UPI001FCE64E8|nr:N-acetylmuramoyl-L-alanine amidase [Pukyongiella litopenaei]
MLHYTAMDSASAALDRLCDPAIEVSAHYLIGGDGTIWQMVDEAKRAWHAGAGEWRGLEDINSRSIGIELDNRGDHPFSEPQMAALEDLLRDVMQRHRIGPAGVIGHSDMAPGRKHDPGPRFDWTRLARQGLALRPAPARDHAQNPAHTPDPAPFRALARAAGYTAPCSDADLLAAVRLRLRPHACGPLDDADMAALAGFGQAGRR